MRTDKVAEAQIRKAQAEGALGNLAGAGKPLSSSAGDTVGEAGYRIMAEAGAVPEEITLKKQVADQLEAIKGIHDPDLRKAVMAKLADLQMRLAIAQEARRAFERD